MFSNVKSDGTPVVEVPLKSDCDASFCLGSCIGHSSRPPKPDPEALDRIIRLILWLVPICRSRGGSLNCVYQWLLIVTHRPCTFDPKGGYRDRKVAPL